MEYWIAGILMLLSMGVSYFIVALTLKLQKIVSINLVLALITVISMNMSHGGVFWSGDSVKNLLIFWAIFMLFSGGAWLEIKDEERKEKLKKNKDLGWSKLEKICFYGFAWFIGIALLVGLATGLWVTFIDAELFGYTSCGAGFLRGQENCPGVRGGSPYWPLWLVGLVFFLYWSYINGKKIEKEIKSSGLKIRDVQRKVFKDRYTGNSQKIVAQVTAYSMPHNFDIQGTWKYVQVEPLPQNSDVKNYNIGDYYKFISNSSSVDEELKRFLDKLVNEYWDTECMEFEKTKSEIILYIDGAVDNLKTDKEMLGYLKKIISFENKKFQ